MMSSWKVKNTANRTVPRQGDEEITAQDVAVLKRSVSYDVLTGWRARLPRVYLGA